MTLKELRLSKGLSQEKAAELCGISRKTYIKYEKDESIILPVKYNFYCKAIEEFGKIDEEHGILTFEQIKTTCKNVFNEYDVEYAFLFGSYAKGNAEDTSDVDILVSTKTTGLKYFGLVESLREALHKKVDVLNTNQLNNNIQLVKEILKDGVKIYG